MTLEELKAITDPKALIEELMKGRLTELPDIEEIEKAIDVTKHSIMDETLRPDKLVKTDDGGTRKEPVARIALGLQKLIIKRAVAFLFGNPIQYSSADEATDEAFAVFKDLLKSAKIDSFNRKVARDLFTTTEVAELWFPVPNLEQGAEQKFNLKVKKLSILTGDELYPYFDQYGDLIAFSRLYEVDKIKYFEVYTADVIYKYFVESGEMAEGYPLANVFGKIPIVYATQEDSAYKDVNGLVDRLEKLLSNFADTNDYHASPKIFIKGIIKGFSKKGESGAIIEGDANSTAEYLSWNNAPEAVKTEIATLKEMIYTISQTPDISFESLKGVGGTAMSGKALKFMFLDAHLKVMDNMEIFDEYLQRRTSIVKAFMSKVRTDMKSAVDVLDIDAEVTPYMFDDIKENLEFIMTANGNKAVLSQKTAIKMSGLVDDADVELTNIQNESSVDVFGPTGL